MSRTFRKFPGHLTKSDFFDDGDFIIRGHTSISKTDHAGWHEIWGPKGKKNRKKKLVRKTRYGKED